MQAELHPQNDSDDDDDESSEDEYEPPESSDSEEDAVEEDLSERTYEEEIRQFKSGYECTCYSAVQINSDSDETR